MNTLDEIMLRHGTDKASRHALIKGHDYARHYDRLFSNLRDKPIKLAEIGVGGGESIRSWLEYFPNAQVFGVDIVHDTNPYNTPGSKEIDRYAFVQGDQSCNVFWNCFKADYGTDFDVLIDDGSHISKDIFTTFQAMWPALKRGGLYFCEDLACSYGGEGTHFTPKGFPTHMDWIQDELGLINHGTSVVDWLHFSQELVVLCKK